jgi:hypothetical protein
VPLSEAQIQQGTSTHVSSIDESQVVTRFIAETLLPTRHGKFRLRGYKHSVSMRAFASPSKCFSRVYSRSQNHPLCWHFITLWADAAVQVDGGVTFTEPSAILTGQVNGLEDVSILASQRVIRTATADFHLYQAVFLQL